MRVAYVCGGFQPRLDGVSAYVERLVESLRERIDPIVVTAHPADSLCGTQLLALQSEWHTDDLLHTAAALERLDVDLVHIQYAPVAFRWRRAVGLLPLLVRSPVVVTAHEFEAKTAPLLRRADAVITTNAEHAERIASAEAGLRDKLRLVPIGPNIVPTSDGPALVATRARVRWSVPGDAPLVVFFGFLHPVKGREYLLRAIVQVRARFPNVRLVLAGGWRSLALPGAEGDAYRERLHTLIHEYSLEETVVLTGFLSDAEVSGLLYAADVAALPFTYGLSFKSGALLAAFAHGCAVVGTQASVDGSLRSGEQLLAVPPRDADALADAILTLIQDGALRERLARAGPRAAAPFNWQAIAKRHEELYSRLCS